ETLGARGIGLQRDEVSLQFPIDQDGDGMADAFWREGTGNDEDGDGLTAWEEYRGILGEGRHRRLNPKMVDRLVVDYAGVLPSEVKAALNQGQEAEGNRLHWVAPAEVREERVGQVRCLVVEPLDLHVLPLLMKMNAAEDQAVGWKSIQPYAGAHTLFWETGTQGEWLAEEFKEVLSR
ncbi:MAG: hypothetical protein AAGJ31_10815, partial [Verrucomicrobiota bacterium]